MISISSKKKTQLLAHHVSTLPILYINSVFWKFKLIHFRPYYSIFWASLGLQCRNPGSIPGSGRSPEEGIGYPLQYSWASLVAQMVKKLPVMWETWVRFLGLGRSPGGGHGNPLQYSCLENPCGQRSLVGYSPWGHKSDTAE